MKRDQQTQLAKFIMGILFGVILAMLMPALWYLGWWIVPVLGAAALGIAGGWALSILDPIE